MKLLITGGAGFIGSALIRHLLAHSTYEIVNVDALTYAADRDTANVLESNPRYTLENIDICNAAELKSVFERHAPDGVIHLAAESHVDRSIDGPGEFIQTNIVGTYQLLEQTRAYWLSLSEDRQQSFRFHHVSTDEVYGSLGEEGLFTETTSYAPNSPYSASKAASDHLVRAWQHTYGLPTLCTNCSNNYGPYQFPEKLIPLMISNALQDRALPVYGDGMNVRDWLHVEDHARALHLVFERGQVGETYNIGGCNESTNLRLVETICEQLDALSPSASIPDRKTLIKFVEDRKGHDRRYAIDASKIERELGWTPRETLDSGIANTIQWYLEHQDWLTQISNRGYHGQRLGLGESPQHTPESAK